jgi:hypothetical protein
VDTDATSSPESPARDSFNLVFAQISEEWHTLDGFNRDASRSP